MEAANNGPNKDAGKGAWTTDGKSRMLVEEASAALAVGINPFPYRDHIVPPSGMVAGMVWALNNHDALEREANERAMDASAWAQARHRLLLEQLGPFWDSGRVFHAFREAEQASRSCGLPDPLTIAYYAAMKEQVESRETTFEEALGLALVHYGASAKDSAQDPGKPLAADLNNLFDPDTGLLRLGFSVPNPALSLTAKTELETLRGAQLRLFGRSGR